MASIASASSAVTVPDHIRLTGQSLRFRGYFNESVVESATERARRRIVLLRYFLEDDTFELFESRRRNDGIMGTKFLARQQHDAVTLSTLRVGSVITLYGRAIRITECDDYTRGLYEERGFPQPTNEDTDEDDFARTQRADERGGEWNGKRTNAISRYVEAVRGKAVHKKDTLRQFLASDGNCLRFYALWDETKTKSDIFALKRRFIIKYDLSNDEVELVSLAMPGEAKTSDSIRFLSKRRMPKRLIVHDDRMRSCEDGTGDEDYCTADDFRVGEELNVYSKPMLLYDCDSYTQEWYLSNKGIDQKARAIDVSEPAKPRPRLPVPPPNGFGSDADSLHSVKYLDPRAHRQPSDLKRFLASTGKTLKFFVSLVTEHPVDKLRRYRITWYLDDDSLAIYENPIRNTGIEGAKWQAQIGRAHV